jgi:hypothetical protein
MTFFPTGRRAFDFVAGRSELSGYLLAWAVPLWFCLGLVGLAVSPWLGVAVPRWLILIWGAGCALLALLAGAAQQPSRPGRPSGKGKVPGRT